MMKIEYQVMNIIPALRREIMFQMIELKYKQTKIAKIFGVSEACLSQYKKSKRAMNHKLAKKTKELIGYYIARGVFDNSPEEVLEYVILELLQYEKVV